VAGGCAGAYLFYGMATRTFSLLVTTLCRDSFTHTHTHTPQLQSTAEVISHKNIFTHPQKMCKAAKPLPI